MKIDENVNFTENKEIFRRILHKMMNIYYFRIFYILFITYYVFIFKKAF